MPCDLEKGQRKGGFDDCASGVSYSMLEGRDGRSKAREKASQIGEEDAPPGHASELYYCQSNRLGIGVEDGFRGSVGQGGAHIPDKT